MKRRFLLTLAAMALGACAVVNAQTITRLTHPAPDGAETVMLLTDGRALVQGNNDSDWWTLTPDINGSYVNGTWTQVASLPAGYSPYAETEAVMIDGRVIIEGGEYNFGSFAFTNQGAVYDPVANTWTMQPPPDGWDFFGDSPSAVLPNGKFMIGQKMTMKMAELDPHTLTWTALQLDRQERLVCRRRLDPVAERNHPDRRRAEFSQLRALRPDHADLDSGRQHAGTPDGSTGSGLHQRSWGTYCPPGEIGPAGSAS